MMEMKTEEFLSKVTLVHGGGQKEYEREVEEGLRKEE